LSRYAVPPALVALALVGAAAAGVLAHSGSSGKVTKVIVSEKEYKLTLSQKSFKPGTYAFVAEDKGKVAHSLAIAGPDIRLKRIPGTIRPGASRTLTVTLTSGTYSLWCPVDSHAKLGMKLKLTVAGAATTTTTSTTTTGGGGGGWG